MSNWKPEHDDENVFPTVADIKSAARYDSKYISIEWDEIDKQGERFDEARDLIRRLPALELLYNTWREKAMGNDASALALSPWILQEVVDEMFSAYTLSEVVEKFDAIKSIEALDKGL